MKTIATLLLLIIFLSSQSQEVERKDSFNRKEYEKIIRNLEKQEKSNSSTPFRIRHSYINYERFEGRILILNDNSIQYENRVLMIQNTSNELKGIFEKGILYPSLFLENQKTELLEVTKSDSTSMKDDIEVVAISLYREGGKNRIFLRKDPLTISDLREQKNFSKSPKERRFEFLLFYNGFANPTEYFIELYNENATGVTDVETFINGAKLRLIEKGSIQI